MADPRPQWVDDRKYPYASRYVDLGPGRMHYIDVGPESPQHTVVLLHGNPTWSFMYRDVIRRLARRHRCVAPDWIGFGLSDHPRGWTYRPEDHVRCLEELMEALDLGKITLVVHDWGGPIGACYASENPTRIEALVVANSWLWPPEETRLRAFGRTFNSGPGRFAITRLNALTRLMPLGAGGRFPIESSVRAQYENAQSSDRLGSAMLAGAFHTEREWLASLWKRRAMLQGLPIALVWGLRDPAIRPTVLNRWIRAFPDAYVVRLDAVGHFVPEEAPQDVARAAEQLMAHG